MRCPPAIVLLVVLAACAKEDVVGIEAPTADSGLATDALAFFDGTLADDLGHADPAQDAEPIDAEHEAVDAGTSDADPLADAEFSPDTGGHADAEPMSHDAAISHDGSIRDSGMLRDAQISSDGGSGCHADSDCSRGRVCDPMSRTCVSCYEDSHCSIPGQKCDLAVHSCRFGCVNGQCFGSQVCDPAIDACVDCLTDMHCDDGEVCHSRRHSCVECTSNAHCTTHVGLSICDTARSECVGCQADGDCTAPERCDPQDHFCRLDQARPLCEACDDDSQCGGANDLCVGYNGTTDKSCATDCRNSPCPRGFECIDARTNTVRVCRPRYPMQTPTCTAIRNLGATCRPTEPDPGCGIPNTQDARCVQTQSGAVCSIWCGNDADCPNGYSCLGATPNSNGTCH